MFDPESDEESYERTSLMPLIAKAGFEEIGLAHATRGMLEYLEYDRGVITLCHPIPLMASQRKVNLRSFVSRNMKIFHPGGDYCSLACASDERIRSSFVFPGLPRPHHGDVRGVETSIAVLPQIGVAMRHLCGSKAILYELATLAEYNNMTGLLLDHFSEEELSRGRSSRVSALSWLSHWAEMALIRADVAIQEVNFPLWVRSSIGRWNSQEGFLEAFPVSNRTPSKSTLADEVGVDSGMRWVDDLSEQEQVYYSRYERVMQMISASTSEARGQLR